VSEGPYSELNLGLHVGDDVERVIENRRRVCRALGVDFDATTFPQHAHGNNIRMVSWAEAGAGRTRFEDAIPDTDGLVVKEPGVTIAVLAADCVPILLYDPEKHIAAVIHAGSRGTAAGIAHRAVRFLVEECGCSGTALVGGVGPAIGPCCCRVSEDMVEALVRGFNYIESVAERRGGDWYYDLPKANVQQLTAGGMALENIECSGICNYCNTDEFYSDLKLGRPTGRFGAFASLRP
jgi:YfiH family protein